jgi:hypothetical protein
MKRSLIIVGYIIYYHLQRNKQETKKLGKQSLLDRIRLCVFRLRVQITEFNRLVPLLERLLIEFIKSCIGLASVLTKWIIFLLFLKFLAGRLLHELILFVLPFSEI